MKILFVSTNLSIEAGGVASAVCGLAESMAARGHSVTIVGLDLGGTSVRPVGVQVQRLQSDGKSKLGHSRTLNKWLCENAGRFEVVHIHGVWQQPGHYAARWARKYGVPYLVAPHGMLDSAALHLRQIWAKRLAWLLWDQTMCRRAAAMHCLNEAEYRVSPWIHGLRHVVISNGITRLELTEMPMRGEFRRKHEEWFSGAAVEQEKVEQVNSRTQGRWGANRPMALFLGRIHPKKGLDRLFAHWQAVLQKQPDLLLVVAGAGEPGYVNSLQAQCRTVGIDGAVVWAGQLVGREKYEALVDADVFVLPSYQEGFSMAITEALAAGCPVVITRPCNFDEVGEVNAGVIVEDMPGFAEAVRTLLADAAMRSAMGENGRMLVRKNFTWEIVAAKLEMVYQELGRRN